MQTNGGAPRGLMGIVNFWIQNKVSESHLSRPFSSIHYFSFVPYANSLCSCPLSLRRPRRGFLSLVVARQTRSRISTMKTATANSRIMPTITKPSQHHDPRPCGSHGLCASAVVVVSLGRPLAVELISVGTVDIVGAEGEKVAPFSIVCLLSPRIRISVGSGTSSGRTGGGSGPSSSSTSTPPRLLNSTCLVSRLPQRATSWLCDLCQVGMLRGCLWR